MDLWPFHDLVWVVLSSDWFLLSYAVTEWSLGQHHGDFKHETLCFWAQSMWLRRERNLRRDTVVLI